VYGSRGATLVALCGRSPAVITETVWCLIKEGIQVEEIIVLTTEVGREAIISTLFADEKVWSQLANAVATDLRFAPSSYHIRLIPSEDGKGDLADIATTSDNQACADFFLKTLHQLTENTHGPLICSIAGGRKTMGTLMASCLTLVGRPQDRLCHVLVSEPFDNPRLDPPFYFPGCAPGHQLAGKTHSNTSAHLELIDVPFIKVHPYTRSDINDSGFSFMDLVKTRQTELDAHRLPHVTIGLFQDLQIDAAKITLSPQQHGLLLAELCACAAKTRPVDWLERLDWIKAVQITMRQQAENRRENDHNFFNIDPHNGNTDGLRTLGKTLRKTLDQQLSPHLSQQLFPSLRQKVPPYPPHRIACPDVKLT